MIGDILKLDPDVTVLSPPSLPDKVAMNLFFSDTARSHMVMEMPRNQKERIGLAGAVAGLDFIRLFGSFLENPEGGLDVDLAVGAAPLRRRKTVGVR